MAGGLTLPLRSDSSCDIIGGMSRSDIPEYSESDVNLIALFVLVIGCLVGSLITWMAMDNGCEKKAIANHCAQYNAVTGAFEWKDAPKP